MEVGGKAEDMGRGVGGLVHVVGDWALASVVPVFHEKEAGSSEGNGDGEGEGQGRASGV